MSVFQIIMLIVGLLMALFSFYIGYVFFLGSTEKKSFISLTTALAASDIGKFILGLIQVGGVVIIIFYIIKNVA